MMPVTNARLTEAPHGVCAMMLFPRAMRSPMIGQQESVLLVQEKAGGVHHVFRRKTG
jgi:hypothetical protein